MFRVTTKQQKIIYNVPIQHKKPWPKLSAIGRVKNVSKRVLKNPTAFLLPFYAYYGTFSQKKAFKEFWMVGSWPQNGAIPFKSENSTSPKHRHVGCLIQRQYPRMLALYTQKSIWVSISGEVYVWATWHFHFFMGGTRVEVNFPPLKNLWKPFLAKYLISIHTIAAKNASGFF